MNTPILQQLSLFSNEPDTVEIPLSKGFVAIVNSVDRDLAEYNWRVNALNYAIRNLHVDTWRKRTTQLMHRVILGRMLGRELETWEVVDHIDNNPSNNRRNNLRLATRQQNTYNSRVRRTNKSGLKGVHAVRGRWRACVNGTHLGYFDTPEEAHAAYCAKAKELFGEFFNPG